MNDTPVTTYPSWQTTVRQAQAEMNRRAAEEQQKRDQQEIERQKNLGLDLARALARYGIEVETPEKNEIVLNDFVFSIHDEGYRVGNQDRTISFTLLITKRKPAYLSIFDWGGVYEKIVVHNKPLEGDWSVRHAELADKLDTVDRAATIALGNSDLAAAKDAMLPDPSAPSLNQQLGDLIRRMVREELDGQ